MTADGAGAVSASMSVVVCAFTAERALLLGRCIDSITAELGPNDELIVVIDYNEALFGAVSARYAHEPVRVVRNAGPRGLSGARNTGVDEAARDIVAFIDDDAEVSHGWVQRVRGHYGDDEVVGVGGFARPSWPAQRPGWFPEEFDWVVGCSHRGVPTVTGPVRNLLGCNMTFRRSALQTVGGFSSEVGRVGVVPLGCEETELCIRLRQRSPGREILFDPDLTVRHHVSADRVKLGYFVRRCWGEGKSKYRVSTMVGSTDALSAERSYVVGVLSAGVLRGLLGAMTGPRRLDHLARSASIVLGLAVTTLGYGAAMARGTLSRTVATSPR